MKLIAFGVVEEHEERPKNLQAGGWRPLPVGMSAFGDQTYTSWVSLSYCVYTWGFVSYDVLSSVPVGRR